MRRYGATMASNRQVTGGGQPSWPELTAAQMREVDRIMIEELGIDLLQMMELAGAHLADLAVRMVGPRTATVLAGTGGNGGGGLVAARHLANRGVRAAVTLAGSPAAGTVTAHQLDILGRIGVPVVKDPPGADVVLDALIGYSLRGDPTARRHSRSPGQTGNRRRCSASTYPAVSTRPPAGPAARAWPPRRP
jgi:hypothetical protein